MRSRDIFGRLRLRLRLRGSIPAPAPSKSVRRLQLRLRLRAKCTGSGSDDQVLIWALTSNTIFKNAKCQYIGCPRIIRTCSFSRFSPLRWNRWCGFQNIQNYSSRVKAKRHTLPKSAYYSVQSLDQVSVGESFFPFCSKTKQATRYWQEAQPRLPQQTHWHDICWRA